MRRAGPAARRAGGPLGPAWAGNLVDVREARARPAAHVVSDLVDHVGPALEPYGDLAQVQHGVELLLREGTGADVQRATLLATRRFEDVVLRSLVRVGTAAADPL